MKSYIPILIAILFPFVLIGVIALYVYVPQRDIHTAYNFVVTTYESNVTPSLPQKSYYVDKGKIIERVASTTVYDPRDPYYYPGGPSQALYIYNSQTDTLEPTTYDKVKDIQLTTSTLSPDGFTFEQNYPRGFFPFYGGQMQWVLRKGNQARVLNVPQSMYSLNLLGWYSPTL